MPLVRFTVAVIMERIALVNRWANEQWQAAAVELDADAEHPPEPLATDAVAARWRVPGHTIELHPSEGEGYYLNLASGDPKVFVMWRMLEPDADEQSEPRARPVIVTVSYGEAARFLDAGEQVDAVPMPTRIRAALEPFVAEHFRPEPRKKVRRNELYEGDAARRAETFGGRRR